MKKTKGTFLLLLAILAAFSVEIGALNFLFGNFRAMPVAVTFGVSAVIDSLSIIVYSKRASQY
jgi:uncharacterized integral membrane protein